MSTVAPEKAIYKPGDMFWTSINPTNAGNAGGMQKQEDMLPWSAYMERKSGGSGGRGRIYMDDPERWRKRVKDPDGDYELDLVEEFFSNLDLN